MIYGFNSEDVAQELKRIGLSSIGGEGTDPDPTGLEVIFVKTPSAGIAGKDGSGVMSEGECTLAHIDDDEFSDDSDTVDIINTGTDALSGDTYIAAVKSGVNWVPIVGGGGGSAPPNYLCQAPVGGVPARSGNNASQTDCDIYEINASSGAISSTGDTVSIYNVWSQGIASNAYFTAKQVDGVYVPDAEDCTGN